MRSARRQAHPCEQATADAEGNSRRLSELVGVGPSLRVSYSRDASIRLFESVPRLPGVYRFRLSGSEWGCLWETDSKKAESLKQSAPGEPVCLTQYPAVREYWGRTGHGDRNADVRQVGMCSKCNVIFPKGTGGGGNCALCV